MGDFRIEKDSLGEVRVPANAVYGAQTQRAVDNFPISGQRMPRAFIRALGHIKRAAAKANADTGMLDRSVAEAIIKAAEAVIAGDLDDQFPIDVYQTGSGTSSNMNANEVIARLATGMLEDQSVHPNDQVNLCQSSNDVIPTSMQIAAACMIEDQLLPALHRLELALQEKSRAFDDIVKSARTHLMDATPITMGQEFGGYAMQITRGIGRIRVGQTELSEVPLGGTATGSGINRHLEFPQRTLAYVSEHTGVTFREAENHFEAQSARDAVVSASGALNTVAVSLMKIANDIRILSSGPTSGIAEITLQPLQPGSSIMPGKVNPVLCEAMMMVCARVMGNHTTITVCGQHGNLELNVMMPVMAVTLLESIELLAGASNAFVDKCLAGLEANRARCQELLELNPSLATALNSAIGYDLSAKVAKEAAASGRTVREVVLEMNLLDEKALDALLDVHNMTQPGIPGSQDTIG
ncbi:MAG: class II fumarate hydratase [Rhodothermaceae bacterium]|nr:class II fumarate hydratase [Rhodothermaceae bacterium]MXX59535.1 class II fumarate hydratase [Rhodothermaceae bacterium]MYD19328.1 class II fumarate hydratase [Rhodothermaceae bacterium]MYD57585.1 class II fumarate hydratase [Rhodothermaceae bacterium]MYI43152.1 class II fumarate hydratase [Rhodothermaceae bacterium]